MELSKRVSVLDVGSIPWLILLSVRAKNHDLFLAKLRGYGGKLTIFIDGYFFNPLPH